MALTEAQRLAFLKGREKRKANIEKKKLEAAEKEMFAKMEEAPMEQEQEAKVESPPPKPKVRRTKTIKPAVVDVKVEPDPVPEPESKEATAAPPVPVSYAQPPSFDEDQFADKIVSMLLSKGIGAKPSPRKPREVKPKKAKPIETAPAPPTSTFSWL